MFRTSFLKSQSVYQKLTKKFSSNSEYDLCIIGGGPAGRLQLLKKNFIILIAIILFY